MIKTRFVLPVLAAAAALALLAGCGSDSSSSSTDPASLAPPESPVFVEGTLRPSGELASNIDTLAESIAGVDDLGETIVSELESSAQADGEPLDYKTEVEPWLGKQAGVSFQGFDGNDFQGYSVAIQSTDAEATQDFVDKQRSQEDEPAKEGSYEGVDYGIERDDGTTIGVVGDFLVIAEDEQSFKDAVDASNGESLADLDPYTSAVSRVPGGSLADAYVDIGALVKQSGGDIDAQAQQVLKSTGIELDEATAVASLVPGSNQVEIDISSDLGNAELNASAASELLGSLPASSFAAVASSDFGKNLQEGIDSLDASGIPGQIPPNQLKEGLKGVGIDLEKIAGSFEDIGAFATGNSESSLGGAAVITTKSGSEAKNTVSSLGLLLRATDSPGVTALTGKASGFSIRDPDLGRKPLVVAAEGDRIAIGYGVPATLLGLSSKPSATLSSLPDYKEAVAALGGTPITGFVNGPATLRLVESLVPHSEVGFQEAKPYLKKVGYIAIGSDTSDGVATAKLILGLQK
jgi:hypothetical protein